MGLFDKTAIIRPGEDSGNTSTSGLGGLISLSDLYKNALQGNNQNVSGAFGPQDYLSRIETEEGPFTMALGPEAYVQTLDPRYVSDAYQYFLQGTGGGPDAATIPATTVAQAPDAPITTGGGGGGNLLDQLEDDAGIDAPINIDTMTVKEAFTQDPAYTGIDTAPDYSDVTTAVAPPSILNPYEPQTLASPTLNKMDTSEIDIENFLDSEPALTAGKPEMLGDTGDSMDYMSGALDAPYGVNPNTGVPYQTPRTIADQNAVLGQTFTEPATTLGSQINSAFENVKGKGTEAVGELTDNLVALGGKVREGFENIVDFGETQIDVGKTLATGAINYLGKSIFGPIGAFLGTALQALPEGGRSEMSDKLGEQYGMDDIGRLTGGPMAGYAVDSTFGKGIEQSTADVKNDVGNTLSEKYGFTKSELNQIAEGTYTGTKGYNEIMGKVTNLVDKYKDLSNFEKQIDKNKTAIDYDMEGTDEGDRAAEEAAEARKEGLEELSDIYSGIGQTRDAPSPTPQEIPDRGRGDGRDTGPTESPQGSGDPYGGGEGGVQSGLGSPDVGEVSSDAGFSEPSNQGGGGGGGGKIVCTMMNDSYGFGSFRNKIWLRQSKNLAPEYQIGYHKIFLPLVRLSKTNKLLKKTLEHIAVHRTIDIRQEARGKVHLLGRVYRKVLEPICYWVGKHAKR